jgi:hypothetical protein
MERSVDIQLGPDDLVQSAKLQFLTFLRSRRGMVRLGLCALIAGIGFGMFMWDGSVASGVVIAVYIVLLPLAIVAVPGAIVWFVTPHTSRRMFAQQASLRQPYRMTWDDTHYRATGDSGQAVIAWTDFFRVERNDRLITLYESQALRRIIPLRFLTPEQRADIERVIAPLLGK